MIEQRSEEWFNQRLGKFTSSNIHKLMGIKGLGETGNTYCFELAVDLVEGRDLGDNLVTFDMQRGIDLEPFAIEKFTELMSLRFVKVEQTGFIELNDYTGSSPDSLVGDDGVLEIKCPKRDNFFKIVANDYEAIKKEYFLQMQHQMYCTNRNIAYFFNFYIHNGNPLWHLIEVPRDDETIEKMEGRIEQAKEIRDSYIDQILSNIQYKQFEF